MAFQSAESLDLEKEVTQTIHAFLCGKNLHSSPEYLVSERYAFCKTLLAVEYFSDNPGILSRAKKDFKRFEDLYKWLRRSLIENFDETNEDLLKEYLTKYVHDQLFCHSCTLSSVTYDVYGELIHWPDSGNGVYPPSSNDIFIMSSRGSRGRQWGRVRNMETLTIQDPPSDNRNPVPLPSATPTRPSLRG